MSAITAGVRDELFLAHSDARNAYDTRCSDITMSCSRDMNQWVARSKGIHLGQKDYRWVSGDQMIHIVLLVVPRHEVKVILIGDSIVIDTRI